MAGDRNKPSELDQEKYDAHENVKIICLGDSAVGKSKYVRESGKRKTIPEWLWVEEKGPPEGERAYVVSVSLRGGAQVCCMGKHENHGCNCVQEEMREIEIREPSESLQVLLSGSPWELLV